jgi:hypothetical protein
LAIFATLHLGPFGLTFLTVLVPLEQDFPYIPGSAQTVFASPDFGIFDSARYTPAVRRLFEGFTSGLSCQIQPTDSEAVGVDWDGSYSRI